MPAADPKILLELLRDGEPSERVRAVAEVLFQGDNYMRLLRQAITGLAFELEDTEKLRDFLAFAHVATEISDFFARSYQPLCEAIHAASASDSREHHDIAKREYLQ